MARVWHQYGISMPTPCQTLAKPLPKCCRPGAEYHPNIKVTACPPEVIVKKVKNEPMFIAR